MSFASYPRKGSITRIAFKTLLEADSVVNQLSDTQQNSLIDIAVHQVATLRNSLSLNDYNFDTMGNAQIDITALGYSKYVRYAIIEAGITYNGTLYDVATILVEQTASGFTGSITTGRLGDVVTFTCTGQFTNDVLTDTHYAPVIVTNNPDNSRDIDVTNSDGVVIVEFFKIA